ncbi:hypothetical protein ACVK00_006284 [Burkholderia sp. PvR073]
MTVSVRSYLSPTLVLLAFDWPEAALRADFLGFAIRRTPGFWSADGKTRAPNSWLPNRLTFDGPAADTQGDAPTDQAPIQKFIGICSEKPRHFPQGDFLRGGWRKGGLLTGSFFHGLGSPA